MGLLDNMFGGEGAGGGGTAAGGGGTGQIAGGVPGTNGASTGESTTGDVYLILKPCLLYRELLCMLEGIGAER